MAEHNHQGDQVLAVSAAPDDHYYEAGSIRSVQDGVMEEYTEKAPPPRKRQFYRQKQYWIVCSILTIIIVVVTVLLVLYVFFAMIAQGIIDKSKIEVQKANIGFSPPEGSSLVARQEQYDMNSTFFLDMETSLTKTGPFNAHITFHNPIDVYYNDTLLGYITLPNAFVSHGHGSISAITPFQIADTTYFAAFTKDMLAAETFVWNLRGKLTINALSRSAAIDLNKDITLQGMNNFPNVTINSFNLPADAPGGGIEIELGTILVSPSPIGVQLGTIALQVAYEGILLGTVTSKNVTLQGGVNNLTLSGVLSPLSNSDDLQKIGVMFSNYLNGLPSLTTAIGLSCAPDGVDPISWLSEGFESVHLNVVLQAAQPINVIQGISLGYLNMDFSSATPYAPLVSAPAVIADYSVPFGFTLNITQVAQDIQLGTNDGGYFASLSVPFIPSQSDPTTKKIQFPLTNAALNVITGKESQFDGFTYDLAGSAAYTFNINGSASTVVQTPIGQVTLTGIKFLVPTTLNGLQFLNSTPTTISSVDLTGGTTAGLSLSVGVSLTNPADFSISAGDVTMEFLQNSVELGSVLLSNLSLARGVNNLTALTTFDPNVSPVGGTLLSTFVMGQTNEVQISGFAGSTPILSLKNAFGAISLGTSLPGLSAPLIQGSSLTVYETTPTDGIVGVQVTIANPFTASMSITSVVSSVTYEGMPVGNINQDISSNPIVLGGHAAVLSNPLSMTMNVEPAAIALLMRELAVAANLDTQPLDALLGMGGLQVAGMSNVAPTASLFDGFNIVSYVEQAMTALSVDLQLQSGLTVGDYQTTLTFSQSAVKVTTDDTIGILIPIVGQPIVQQIVDGAVFALETVVLSNPTDTAFDVQMSGSITNTGPMDAIISFPSPLTVAWQGRPLGTVAMPNITAKADVGATFDLPAVFTVSDADAMGDFAGYLINNADFIWDIYTKDLSVNALGFQFNNVNMEKFVTLKGANGFKDAVVINSFNLPANDPSGDGIILTANTTIFNPSQVGFNLNGAAFAPYFDNVYLGPLASDGAAFFAPNAYSNIAMKGTLIRQTTDEGLAAVKQVFVNYLSNKPSTLLVRGVSGSGPNGEVRWLTAGFQTIAIDNVILPAPGAVPELIPAVTMENLQLDFTQNPWAPPTGSRQVEAQLKSPFGFPITVTSLSMEVDAAYQGANIAHLSIPTENATTNSAEVITTQFSDIPFAVYDNAHDLFCGFVALLTVNQNVTFNLIGSSNAYAEMAVGDMTLDGIQFNVATELAGLNNLDGTADILSINVTGATPDYIIVDLQLALSNPSQISVILGDVTYYVTMNEFSAEVGEVYITGLSLVPGVNQVSAKMHMHSTNTKAISQLLSNYMTAAVTPLSVQGKTTSTEIVPLQQALASTHLSSTMTGISTRLIRKADVLIPILSASLGGNASTIAYLRNPLDTPYGIVSITASIVMDIPANTYMNNPALPDFEIGSISFTLDTPFWVQPGDEVVASDVWPCYITKGVEYVGSVLTLYTENKLYARMYQNVTMMIGDGYEGSLYYYEYDVGLCLFVTSGSQSFPMGPCIADENETPPVEAQSLMRTATENPAASPATWFSNLPPDLQAILDEQFNITTSAAVSSTTSVASTVVAPTTTSVSLESSTESAQEPTTTAQPASSQPATTDPAATAAAQAATEAASSSPVELVLPF